MTEVLVEIPRRYVNHGLYETLSGIVSQNIDETLMLIANPLKHEIQRYVVNHKFDEIQGTLVSRVLYETQNDYANH